MRDATRIPQLASTLSQHNRILRLSFPHGDGPAALLLADTLEASEGLSRPFSYTLGLLSDDAHIALKDLQGAGSPLVGGSGNRLTRIAY